MPIRAKLRLFYGLDRHRVEAFHKRNTRGSGLKFPWVVRMSSKKDDLGVSGDPRNRLARDYLP